MKALDFGNFTDIPTPEQVRCWLSQGYTKAIIGTSFGSVWQQQIAVCEANGMDVEEYQFVRHLVPTTRRWWLDVELGEKEAQIRAAVISASPYGIYTRKNIWDALSWDIVAEFPQLKLWDAAYAEPPLPFVPYGGWTSRAMHQWHDSTLLCDLNVDLNIVEERMYSDAEIDAKIGAVLEAVVALQKSVDNPTDPVGLKQDIQQTFQLALRNQTRLDALEVK